QERRQKVKKPNWHTGIKCTFQNCNIWLFLEQHNNVAFTNNTGKNLLKLLMWGCKTEWDDIGCWRRAEVGQVVNLSCSEVFQHFSSNQGYVYRNCTVDGWSEMYPPYEEACVFSDDSEPESECRFMAKFRCTRNYIHINLFSSFVLRASAVFIKDTVLFADETLDHCSMSTVTCKSAVAFFQFSILANYFWLLVEGMYLQTLLALTFVSQRKYFWWYILIGWGDCWDDNDNVAIWWIIKGPITASLLVIFMLLIFLLFLPPVLLVSLRRLAKSTLFLIPLFGMHYTVFAFLPENTGVAARLYIELGLGSFQVQHREMSGTDTDTIEPRSGKSTLSFLYLSRSVHT
uniref:Growth hormone releasing hormone receptor a n=1 Tax=Sphaeramia orbicularis TaxID=375764 RepID=A0A672YE76_9TELE